MRSITTKHILSLVVLAVFAILAAGSGNSSGGTKDVQSQSSAYSVTADGIYAEYQANEVAGDAKYKGKIITVSGTIMDIGKDITGDPYVVLGGTGYLDGVQGTFATSESASIGALSKGQQATIKGKCDGLMGMVEMSQCSLQ